MEQFCKPVARYRAILFDVDGTLYPQVSLRLYMLARLTRAFAIHPRTGFRCVEFLCAYRRAQEHLRNQEDSRFEQQLSLSCGWSGVDSEFALRCVERWIQNEPLSVIHKLVRPGVRSFLERARAHKMKLGVVSDYPAEEKLEAMGLRSFFDVVVSAQQVGAFKPSPKGLNAALRLLNVTSYEAAYVGDRLEVDGEAAQRANMTPVIIGKGSKDRQFCSCVHVTSFRHLEKVFFGAQR